MKTKSLRGIKLAKATSEERELYHKQEKERSEFDHERLMLFRKFGKRPEEHKVGKSLYFMEECDLATGIRELAIKHGGEASVWEAKLVERQPRNIAKVEGA